MSGIYRGEKEWKKPGGLLCAANNYLNVMHEGWYSGLDAWRGRRKKN